MVPLRFIIASQAQAYIRAYKAANQQMVNYRLSRGMRNWNPLAEGVFKVNFDGAFIHLFFFCYLYI